MLDDFGLLPTLLWYFEKFTKQTGIRINFKHDGMQAPLVPEVNTAVYRIIQEALTNVVRYANVKEVEVRVVVDGHVLSLEIQDHGSGFSPSKLAANASTGFSGMRERALALGGKLIIETHPGKGTRISAELPVSHEPVRG